MNANKPSMASDHRNNTELVKKTLAPCEEPAKEINCNFPKIHNVISTVPQNNSVSCATN